MRPKLRQTIQDEVEKLRDWQGNPYDLSPSQRAFHPPRHHDVKKWAKDMYEWACRVRRDIIIIEQHIISLDPKRIDEFYGDPGDPPPPPE